MNQIYEIYYQLLGYFPSNIQWIVSLALAGLLILAIFQIIKRNFIFIILLVILLPASVPIVKDVWEHALNFVKFLLTKR